MSGPTKRQVLGLAAGAAAAVPFVSTRTIAAGVCRPRLAVYDSRIAESARFAANAARDGARTFDIAKQEDSLWREDRGGFGLANGDSVIAMTRWSDYVALRALLAARGLRVTSEQHLSGSVFAWAMVQKLVSATPTATRTAATPF